MPPDPQTTPIRARNWCFILCNYTPEDEESIAQAVNEGHVRFCLYGREIAPTTGTPHLQGYMQFDSMPTLKVLKRMFPRAHFEIARLDYETNAAYCKKDGDYVTLGTPKGKPRGAPVSDGVKKTLSVEAIREYGSVRKMIDQRFSVTISDIKVAREVLAVTKVKRVKPTVYWIYGPSGTGKTRLAYHIAEKTFGEDEVYRNIHTEWFDGYDGQKAIILDDYRWHLKTPMLLALMDRYDLRVPIKGSFVNVQAEMIIVTTILPPYCGWTVTESIKQLDRRVTKFIALTKMIPEWHFDDDLDLTFEGLQGVARITGSVLRRNTGGGALGLGEDDMSLVWDEQENAPYPSQEDLQKTPSFNQTPSEDLPPNLKRRRREIKRPRPIGHESVNTERISPISINDDGQASVCRELYVDFSESEPGSDSDSQLPD